ncbi:MAG: FecR domain-containing protein [Leptolyngbya sp. SIO1D8]|nr:FecR domain-containing protein [Leptolyngbya sp. SIO1D8]
MRTIHPMHWAMLLVTTIVAAACQQTTSNNLTNTDPSIQATIVDILGQQATLNGKAIEKQAMAHTGDLISTTQARAELSFNNGAVSRLGQNAALVVGETCAQISQGHILVSGTLDVCTDAITTSVRGTTYSVEIYPEGGGHIGVFEGEVVLASALNPDLEPLTLTGGQGIDFTQAGTFENQVNMSQSVFESIIVMGELVDDFEPLPTQAALQESFETLYPEADFPQ